MRGDFVIGFNCGNGADTGYRRYGGSLVTFADDNLLNATNGIVLGLRGTGTTKLKIDIVDSGNRKVTIQISGLTSTNQNYKITAAMLTSAGVPNYDMTKIKWIAIVVDDQTAGSTVTVGNIDISTAGLFYSPLATVVTDPVTGFGIYQPVAGELEPCNTIGQNPCTTGTMNTVTSFVQSTTTGLAIGFNLGNGADTGYRRYGGSLVTFADDNLLNATNGIVLGLRGTGTTKLKIDIVDSGNRKVTIQISGLTSTNQNYKITAAMLTSAGVPNYDMTKIKWIAIVVDDQTAGSTTATGTINVTTAGLFYSPLATVVTDPVTGFGIYQPVAGELEPCNTIGQNPCTTGTMNTVTSFVQSTTTGLAIGFNLGNGADTGYRRYGGSLVTFADDNLLNATNGIVLGLRGTGTTKLKIDIVDSGNRKVTIQISGLTSTNQNYKITAAMLTSAGVPNYDMTKIKGIAIVVDDQTAGSTTATGTINVTTAGLFYSPLATVVTDPVTGFGIYEAVAGELEPCNTIGQNPCTTGTMNTVTSFVQSTTTGLAIGFNLGNGADTGYRRYGGSLVTFADDNLLN